MYIKMYVFYLYFRYQKLQKEKLGVGELGGTETENTAAKYVIIEEMDDEEAHV